MTTGFVHLGARSDHSLGLSIARPEHLAREAAAHGQPAMALVDRMSLAGAVSFADAARHLGVKACHGLEAVVPAADGSSSKRYTIRLLAENPAGWRRLVTILGAVRVDNREADWSTAWIPWEAIRANAASLMLVLGRESEVAEAAHAGDLDKVEQLVDALVPVFGASRILIAFEAPVDEEAARRVHLLNRIARHYEFATVAVPEVHCARPEDDLVWQLVSGAAKSPRTLGDLARPREQRAHVLSSAEVRDLWREHPMAVSRAAEIAERIAFDLPRPERRYPACEFRRGVDADSFVWNKCFERATERYGEAAADKWRERLNREFRDLADAHLADGLVCLALLDDALANADILRGPGAGWLTNSLVASLLGLTRLDPLRFDLPFAIPEDASTEPPVMELAIPTPQAPRAAEILRSLFPGALCQATRWQRRTAQAALENVAELLGIDARRVRKLATGAEWERARSEETLAPAGQDPLPTLVVDDPRALAWMARRLEGRVRALRPLPGEFILTPDSALAPLPVQPMPGGEVACQWDASSVEALGFARVRFRHQPLLDLMDEAATWVREQGRREYDPMTTGIEDAGAATVVCEGRTQGIPPLESARVRRELRRRQPRTLPELGAALQEVAGRAPEFEEVLLAWACAAIKAAEPGAFLAAALSEFGDDAGQTAALLAEARAAGIDIKAIDINCSAERWTPESTARQAGLRPGLCLVRDLPRAAVREILTVRREMAFGGLAELLRRTHPRLVRREHVELLARAGALDCFEASRRDLLAQLDALAPLLRPGGRASENAADPLEFFGQSGEWWIDNNAPAPDAASGQDDPLEWIAEQERAVLGHVLGIEPWYFEADFMKDAAVLDAARVAKKGRPGEATVVGFLGHVDEDSVPGSGIIAAELGGVAVEAKPLHEAFLRARRADGRPVLVAGHLEKEGAQWVLRAELVEAPEESSRRAVRAECLEVDASRLDAKALKELLALLKEHPGTTRVRLGGVPPDGGRAYARIESRRITLCPAIELGLNRIAGTRGWRAYVAAERSATPAPAETAKVVAAVR